MGTKRITGYVVAAALLASPASARAQTITLTEAVLASKVEAAVDCYRDPSCSPDAKPGCHLYWRSGSHVDISRVGATTIAADVHLACDINDFFDPDVDIHLTLAFGCDPAVPSIRVTPTDATVDVDWPWYVDVATLSATWWAGNIKSTAATARFAAAGALQSFASNTPLSLSYCPGFAVQSNGDVQIDLAMGNECINGQTRHQRCLTGTHGPGYDYLCVGGRWGSGVGTCDPNRPPHGQDP